GRAEDKMRAHRKSVALVQVLVSRDHLRRDAMPFEYARRAEGVVEPHRLDERRLALGRRKARRRAKDAQLGDRHERTLEDPPGELTARVALQLDELGWRGGGAVYTRSFQCLGVRDADKRKLARPI